MATESWAPSAGREALIQRGKLLTLVRQFFLDRSVLEVETPMLSLAGNSDPGIHQHQTTGGRWLRTSPEYAMKRLLAAQVGDCYELGRVFRAGEAGRWHNPEFTMLEWYRTGWEYPRLMDEVASLITACGDAFGKSWRVRHLDYCTWLEDSTSLDPLTATPAEMEKLLQARGHDTRGLTNMSRDNWLDLLVSYCAEPALEDDTLTFISLYPASQAALSRLHEGDPRLAERFEAYLGKVELANGYQELTDAKEQEARFEAENQKRLAAGLPEVPLDLHLLEALKAGLPLCSGVALGIDRLLAVLTDADNLDALLAFPWTRA